jgi:integrase
MKVNRIRYQFGSLYLWKGVREDVWYFRYREYDENGKRQHRNLKVGTLKQYPTETAAMRAVDGPRLSVNAGKPQPKPVTLRIVVDRFEKEEMPHRYSTRAAYSSLLKLWIKPKWENLRLDRIDPLDVEHWLKLLDLAPKTKANIRNLMHLLHECSGRWKLVETNPIELVRQSAKRLETPRKLTIEEFQKLLDELKDPYRTMVILAGCLGLRVGEILGLQWQDVDLLNGRLHIRRDVYQYVVDEVKTSTSQASLPLAPEVIGELQRWRSQASFIGAEDFVFASERRTKKHPHAGGPRGDGSILEYHIKPASRRAGIGKIGWHTFRHTNASIMDPEGIRMKVAQELLRHADIQTTMNVYTGAMERDKQEAAFLMARRMLKRKPQAAFTGQIPGGNETVN